MRLFLIYAMSTAAAVFVCVFGARDAVCANRRCKEFGPLILLFIDGCFH